LKKDDSLDNMRLDKWLWCSRFFKTRALASSAIKGNKIKVNGLSVKSAKNISVGDQIKIKKSPYEYNITILNLAHNRLSASLAAELYKEDLESIKQREELSLQIKADSSSYPRTIGRPTKRNRREIIRFTRANQSDD
jgi:ribosome-associated heat shock protein Hsp15